MRPKSKDKDFEEFIKQALEENDTSAFYFPGGLETLLDLPDRKELPEVPTNKTGPKHLLIEIVNNRPELYAKYIGVIKMGAFFNTAAEAVGLAEHTVKKWGVKGRADYAKGLDTYYSRFYQDVRRAVAQCRVVREQAIAHIDPKRWLSVGPGRIFGNQWAENPSDDEQIEDQSFTEQKEIVAADESKMKTTVLTLDEGTETAIMNELQKVLNRPKEEEEDASSK